MSINCLKGKFKTKAQALISEDVSESEAIAQVLNQEYTEIMSQLNEISPTQQATPQNPINIYAGTGENAELSNFAKRPFSVKWSAMPDNLAQVKIEGEFDSVEQAFQYYKGIVTQVVVVSSLLGDVMTQEQYKQNTKIKNQIRNANPQQAKSLGRKLYMPKEVIKYWDSVSPDIMKRLIKQSFEQNPDALSKLASTGNATLTHTQDKGKWGKLFPQTLMEVRKELVPSTSPAQQTTSQQDLITLPQQEAITFPEESQEETQYEGLVYDLSQTEVNGVSITELLSEMMTLYVDTVKDPKILDINGVNEVAPTILMMIRQGVPVQDIIYFVNQPIIKEYVDVLKNSRSVSNNDFKSEANIAARALAKYGINKGVDNLIFSIEEKIEEELKLPPDQRKTVRPEKIYQDFTTVKLKRGLDSKNLDRNFQTQILDVFLEMKREAKKMSEMIRSTSPDTQQFKTFSMMEDQLALRDKVSKEGLFINYDKMFDSFIGEFWDSKNDFKRRVSDYLLSQMKGYKEGIDDIKQMMAKINPNPEYREKMIRKIENEFIIFLLNAENKINHEKSYKELFIGDKSVPKLLKKLKAHFEKVLKDNPDIDIQVIPFLNAIIPIINTEEGEHDSIKPSSKRDSAEQKEIITSAIKILADPNAREEINNIVGIKQGESLYDKLVTLAFMQTGANFSPYNIIKYIPAEDYFDFIKDTITAASVNTHPETERFRLRFILNNLKEFRGNTSRIDDTFNVFYNRETKKFRYEDTVKDKQTGKMRVLSIKQKGTPDSLLDYSNTIDAAWITDPLYQGSTDPAIQDRPELQKIDDQLDKKLTSYLKALGVDVKFVTDVRDEYGNVVEGAYAKADMVSQIIEVARDKRQADTITEEAVHMITRMLGENHPIMKQMMNQIPNYDVYNEVKSNDFYQRYNGNEEMIRLEAVGKLITKHILNKQSLPQQQESFLRDWWRRLLNILRRLFTKAEFQNVKKEMDIFEQTAENILNERFQKRDLIEATGQEMYQAKSLRDIGMSYNMSTTGFMSAAINPDQVRVDLNRAGFPGVEVAEAANGGYYFKLNGKKYNPFKSLYQGEKDITQADLVRTFKELRQNIKLDEVIQRYKKEGRIIEQRPSDIVEAEGIGKYKTESEKEKIRTQPKSIISKHFGTILHDVYQNLINYHISSYSNLTSGNDTSITEAQAKAVPEGMQRSHITAMESAVKNLLNEINEEQKNIDEAKTAVVFTEQVIEGIVKGKETAGTMDMVAVYSDAKVDLFDHKFINYRKTYKEEPGTSRVVGIIDPETQIPFYKKRSFELQTGIYRNMLGQIGAKNIGKSRILPNNIQFAKDSKGKLIPVVSQLNPFSADKRFTMPLPTGKELTKHESLNSILLTLFEQNKILDNMISRSKQDKVRQQELILRKEQVQNTIQSIQVNHDVTPMLDTMENLIKNENKIIDEMKTLDDAHRLIRMKKEMNSLLNLQNDILLAIKNKEDRRTAGDQFLNLKYLLDEKLGPKIDEILLQEHEEINEPQRELGFLRNTIHLSRIAQPAFEVARKHIKTAFGKIMRDTQEHIDEVKEKRDALEEWAKGRGMSLMDAYRLILNPKNKRMIFRYSDEFWKTKNEAFEKENVAWLMKNHVYTEEGRKRFEAEFEEFKKSIELTVPTENARKFQLDNHRNKWDLKNSRAWLNPAAVSKYTEVKNPEKHYSNEYKKLLEPGNKPLKEFYDWWTAKMNTFDNILPEKIGETFTPNMRRDIVDTFAQTGRISIKDGWDDFVNGLRARQNDMLQVDGSGVVVPLMYYDNFMYKDIDGEWKADTAKKSEDLGAIMAIFGEAVYRKHHMSNIQHIMDLLKLHLSEQEVLETDSKGRPIPVDAEIGFESGFKLKKSDINVNLFERLIKGLIYQDKLQGKDIPYEWKGKVYSATKTVRSAMSFLSAKSLGWNYVSAFGNLMGGVANMYIKSAEGLYFTKQQMNEARKMMVYRGKDDNLFHHLAEYFKVEKEHWVHREAAKLSASSITRNLTWDKVYLLQQKGDEMVGNLVLMSMLQNYGLDSNGDVQRLDNLPEGSKSLKDRVIRKDDKISVEGMNPDAFDDFRGRVKYVTMQIKGTNTQEDISAMQTDIWGQTLLQFRSWVAPMVAERYGSLKYTAEVKEWEYGRYRSLFKTLVKDRFLPNLKKIIVDVVGLGLFGKYQGDIKLIEKQYGQWKEQNPDIAHKLSINEYIDLRKRTIRAAMVETRMIAAFMVVLGAMAGDWDDDGKADYKKFFASRQFFKLMNRAYLELSFFSNPTSFDALIKDPIPIISLGEQLGGFAINTIDETIDTAMMPFGYEDEGDTKNIGHYGIELGIGFRFGYHFFEDMLADVLKEDKNN